MIRNITVLLLLISVLGCGSESEKNKSYISASACSKMLSDGRTVDCEVDNSSEDRLSKSINFSMKLDASHPGPSGPNIKNLKGSESSYVEKIDDENILYIENGDKIFYAGLKCNNDDTDFKRYLRGTFLGEHKYRINYELTGFENEGVQFAYIWEISPKYDSLSPSNETTIFSLWCSPIEQEAHLFHSRYKLISDFATENAL